MKDRLPELLDPLRLAGKGERLQGQISLDRMDRLKSMLASDKGYIDYQLDFGIDRAGHRNIRGKITSQLEVTCQRCLKRMPYQVDTRVMLGIVQSKQQADQLPAKYEPLVVETDEVSLADIIEDEMILAIPATPMHVPGECGSESLVEKYAGREDAGSTTENSEDVQGRKNPFAVLATLKKQR